MVAAAIGFLFLMSGVELVQAFFRGWAGEGLPRAVAELSFLTNFHAIAQGVIDLRDALFFLSLIGSCLVINTAIVELKKGS